MKLPTLDQVDIKNKKVFVRGDIDIPLNPLDDTRLKDILPTIEYLLNQNCTVFLAGHLGRPGGKEDLSLSSKPVAEWFAQGKNVSGVCLKNNICGFLLSDKLIVLENLRFDFREEANDEEYAKELASLADIYVNEAFASSWETHASIVGVPKFLPHYAGFRLIKEIEMLEKVKDDPQKPLVAVIGGAKLESKLPTIKEMAKYADSVIVGGRLCQDYGEPEKNVKLLKLTADGKDTSLESIDQITDLIANAGTIFWGGPLGVIEDYSYQVGSKRMAELIVNNTTAFKVIGGGDTVGFIDRLGLIDKFNWVCSGGGSMLKFLAGEKLPGIEALLI